VLWVALGRRWGALYTRGLPADVRDRRLLELESDVWEHLHDADERNVRRAVFGRFLRGIPADVWWRYHTLLESRGARARSQNMSTSLRGNWWVILTAILGVVPLGISLAMLATVSGGGAIRLVGVAGAAVSGALLIGGLIRRQSDLIGGSQMIVAGAALTLFGLESMGVGIIVLVSGFWTGNLQLSAPSEAPDLQPVRQQQISMTHYWFLWLAGAALLFAIGWIPLIAEGGDLTWGYFIWVLSWLGAIVTGSIGIILAGLRFTLRHHTRRTDAPASQAT
jgi:hypothetical protein